jgi:heptaprenyl diphosphate synthase
MAFLKRTKRFSCVGISVAGGVFHNVGQILVAVLVLETGALVYYLPVLILSGLAAGIVIGIISGILIRRLTPVIRKGMEE